MGVTRTAQRRVPVHDAAGTVHDLDVAPLRDGIGRRAFDIAGALILLALAAPLLILGSIAVALGSGRPLFFGHERLGRGGRAFRCWKLRTMHADAERTLEEVPALKRRYIANGYKLPLTTDPRVTAVGRVLRRTYVDELPQLYNVLLGDMSLIGPRPIVASELKEYEPHGFELLRARPGIIGAWTSCGRRRPPYPERALLELEYVRNRSFHRDVKILLRTLPVVLRGQPEDA